MAGNPHDIIITYDSLLGEYVVTPSTVVKKTHKVRIKNNTELEHVTDVTIQFCCDEMVEPPQHEPFVLAPGDARTFTIHSSAGGGIHCFAVFCHATMKYALGGSMPIIIVDPKK